MIGAGSQVPTPGTWHLAPGPWHLPLMASRKPFLLRVDRQLLDSVQRWSNDELRSLNGQIEYLLRDALKRAGRLPPRDPLEPAEQE